MRSLASKEDEVQDNQERYQALVGTLKVRQGDVAELGMAALSNVMCVSQLVLWVCLLQSATLTPLCTLFSHYGEACTCRMPGVHTSYVILGFAQIGTITVPRRLLAIHCLLAASCPVHVAHVFSPSLSP